MKKLIFILITLNSVLFGVGEAGAIFLLIAPGAKSQGRGEAMVAALPPQTGPVLELVL